MYLALHLCFDRQAQINGKKNTAGCRPFHYRCFIEVASINIFSLRVVDSYRRFCGPHDFPDTRVYSCHFQVCQQWGYKLRPP